jgi:hypothetical protein
MDQQYGFTSDPAGVPQQPQQQGGNGLAVAGLVMGILSLVLFWIPFLGILLGLLGLIFGGIGIGRANKVGKGKGMAIAGLVMGILGVLLGLAWIFLLVGTRMRM